jgi:DNA end-binding protein Ku
VSFGLVTVPVELVSAVRRARPALRMLGPSGNPLRREYVCPKEDKALRDDEIERGYEIAEGKFVVVTDEELERLAPRSSRDIELTRFVDRASIDPSYFERSYYVVPSGGQTKAYRLLAEVMEETGRAAIAHFVMRDKGYAAALFAEKGILRAVTLRFHDEVRDPGALGVAKPAKVERLRVRRAEAAIRKLAASSVPERELSDPAAERLLSLAREKYERGEDVVRGAASRDAAEDESPTEVVDLIAALRKRIGRKRTTRRPRPRSASAR